MTPNDDTRDQELLARYRRASADSSGPSDAARAAILAESRRLAERLAKQAPQESFDVSRPAANDSRWKITAYGTAGAALLAALLFAPRYWENTPPAQVRGPSRAPASAATQAQTKDEAPARQSPVESNSLQEVIVTQSNRKSAKSYAAPSPNPAPLAATAPPSLAQNDAPASPSAPAERVRPPDLSARAAEGSALTATAGFPTRADSGLKPATLQSAVAQGDLVQAATLLDQGAVIDARDEAGRTPLMLAVTEGRLEIVRLLLARGADPNAADNAGNRPLQQATKRNLQDVAALLEQAGARQKN